ncbi:MAG TPA: CoA transferase [Burkholderiales bacterium]|nr:CoA transferase [Burkholderiales bacterium]
MAGPLAGIRVLDLTTMVSGPVATMMLGDQGADVIKVEGPSGDLMRNYGMVHNGMSSSFLSSNRSKRSLCVDIKAKQGLEIVHKLLPATDVLVQNFRPGAIERMGLGEATVRKLRPDIIFVSISGFGDTGPYAHQRVYDPVIQALCGLAEIQADRHLDGRPRMVRTIIPDKTTAVTAAQAITAALFARERTGQGQHIRIAMLDVMVAYLWPEAISSLSFVGKETDPARGQMGLDLVYQTKDGYITAGAVSNAEWEGMCRALGREDLLNDLRFNTVTARGKSGAERRAITSAEIEKWPTQEILKRLDSHGVPCAPVLSRTDLLTDEQVRTNELIEIHQDERFGPVRQPRPAARFDRTPARVARMAPFLGEHNADILGELGYSAADAERLAREKVVFNPKPQ